MKQRLARLKALLDHDLSPAPIFAVFLGYWLPLEWILNASILRGTTSFELACTIATSAVFNFGLVAALASLVVFLAAGVVSLLGIPFRKTAGLGLKFVAWLVFLAVTLVTLRRWVFFGTPIPHLLRWVLIGGVAAIGLAMALKGRNLGEMILIPMMLAIVLMPLAFVLVACEGAGIGLLPPTRERNPITPRPDILLITLDALSARHLNMYGSLRSTSPNLETFASNAITLKHFYANANWTRPGIASLLNGARPWIHQGDLGSPRLEVVNAQNLAKELTLAGYDLGFVGTNAFASPSFQHNQACFSHGLLLNPIPIGRIGYVGLRFPSLVRSLMIGPVPRLCAEFDYRQFHEKTMAPISVAEALIEGHQANRPHFFWLHLVTPHDPYATPPPFRGFFEPSPLARSVRTTSPQYGFGAQSDCLFPKIYEGRYDEAIRCMDEGLGGFFDWLKKTGRYEQALIVVTADHGESFAQGYGGHGGPLLSEDLIRIPCLIKPPFHKGSERDDRLYEQADLAPTILQMVGLPVPTGMEGYPISQKPEGLPVFAMNHDRQPGTRTFSVAVRLGDWKYVEHWGHWTAPWPQRELYDLASDPGEDRNLVATRPDKATELRGRILAELARRHIDPEKE